MLLWGMAITLDLPPELEGQLRQAALSQGKDISTFLLDNVRQGLRRDVLPAPEAALLQAINAPLAPQERRQRDALLAQQGQRELTTEEQDKLAELIDAVEVANAARWQSIAELAQRRGGPL